MWRTHRSGLAGVGAGLMLAVACHGDPDLPASAPPQLKLVEGAAEIIPTTGLDSFQLAMFAHTLRDMHEPMLDGARAPVGMTVLRMIWVRSFDPPSAVRMVETPGHCMVIVAITGMPGQRYGPRGSDTVWHDDAVTDSGPRLILRRDSSEVAPARCAAVHAAAVAARLWSGPVFGTDIGLDGDDVAFDIVDSEGHRFATRWTPRPGSWQEFAEVEGRFIVLGNVDVRMHQFGGHWSAWAER